MMKTTTTLGPLTILALCCGPLACGDSGDDSAGGATEGTATEGTATEGSGETDTTGETESSGETETTGDAGAPGECSGWGELSAFFPEVSLDDLSACPDTGRGAEIRASLMNFDGITIEGASVVGADGTNVAAPCVEVLCDADYAYIASNALPHYDPQAQPIFDTVDTPIVHRVPLASTAVSASEPADEWLDVAGCQSALSMAVVNMTPEFVPFSHCYFESEDGTLKTGQTHATDGDEVVHKVLCYGQTASMITGIPAFAPCEEARPDPYGSPLFRAYADPGELFVDYCGTHPAAITHNHWINEVCLAQDEDNRPVNSYVTGAAAFDVEALDSPSCDQESDIVGWSYDGYPMRGTCLCMARDGDGVCTDLRRARSGYVYSGLAQWADDGAGDPNITETAVAASHLGTDMMECTSQDDCCPEPGMCLMYCHPLLVDQGGTVAMQNRCVTPDYSWCSHEFVDHASAIDGDYVYLDRCNGVDTADGYTYVGTSTFPYVNSCYKGVPSENALDDTYIRLDAGMGPGMGPP